MLLNIIHWIQFILLLTYYKYVHSKVNVQLGKNTYDCFTHALSLRWFVAKIWQQVDSCSYDKAHKYSMQFLWEILWQLLAASHPKIIAWFYPIVVAHVGFESVVVFVNPFISLESLEFFVGHNFCVCTLHVPSALKWYSVVWRGGLCLSMD